MALIKSGAKAALAVLMLVVLALPAPVQAAPAGGGIFEYFYNDSQNDTEGGSGEDMGITAVCDYYLSACKTSGWVANKGYCLTKSLSTTSSCFLIDANGVTLDLGGFTITGDGSGSDYGVRFSGRTVGAVQNGVINRFGQGGVGGANLQISSSSNSITVSDITITNSGQNGLYFYPTGGGVNVISNLHTDKLAALYGAATFYDTVVTGGYMFVQTGNFVFYNTTITVGGSSTALSIDSTNQAIFYDTSITGTWGGTGISLNYGNSNTRFYNLSISGFASIHGGTQFVQTYNPTSTPVLFSDYNIGSYSIGSASKYAFEDTSTGKITFTQGISGSGSNLMNDIQIATNSIQSNFNKAATLDFYDAGVFADPVPLRNGVACDPAVCTSFQDLGGGDYRYNVASWTTYSVGGSDSTPPSLDWNWTDINQTISLNTTLVCVNASETVNCTLYFDGTGYVNASTGTNICWTLDDLLDGNYSEVNATCEDAADNPANTANAWVNVDTSGPVITINSAQNVTLATTTHVFNVTTNEDANCSVYYSGAWHANTTVGTAHTWTNTSMTQGNHTGIYYRCQDVLNNLADSGAYWLNVDTAGPVITINSAQNTTLASTTHIFNATTNEASNCSFYYDLAWHPNATVGLQHTWTVTGWSETNHTGIYVRCEDTAGNPADSDAYWLHVDALQLGITINSVQNSTLIATSHTFNVSLNENGNCSLYFDTVWHPNATVDTNILWAETLGQGNHTDISYSCQDVPGNPAESGAYWLFVDSIPPSLDWNWTELNETTTRSWTHVCVNLSEVGNCTLNFAGVPHVNGTLSTNVCWNVTGLANGNYTPISATCDDAYGNPVELDGAWVNVSLSPCPSGMFGQGTRWDPCRVVDCSDDASVADLYYELQNDIGPDVAGDCLVISANNVVLDGNGKSIDGDDMGGYGVSAIGMGGINNITIKNFSDLSDFEDGTYLDSTTNSFLNNITASSNTRGGIELESSSGISMDDLTLSGNENGLMIGTSDGNSLDTAYITDSVSYGLVVYTSTNNEIRNVLVSNSGVTNILMGRCENNRFYNVTADTATYPDTLDLLIGFHGDCYLSFFSNYTIGAYVVYLNSEPITIAFENTAYGKINFSSGISDVGGSDLMTDLQLRRASAYVDDATQPGFNQTATISMYDTPAAGLLHPAILRDLVPCNSTTTPSCVNSTPLTAETVVFDVSSWSNYSIRNYPCPWDMDGEGTAVSPCQIRTCDDDPTVSNLYYVLIDNLSSTGTCLEITESDVSLDCDGKNISYASAGPGYGVSTSSGLSGITVKNCITTKSGTLGLNNYGIYLNSATSSIIDNNTISTHGTSANYGIYLFGGSGNDITSNHITTNGTTANYGIYLSSTSSNNINSNVVYGTGSGTGNRAVSIAASSNNNLTSNDLRTDGIAAVVLLSGSSNNLFTSNNITSESGSSTPATKALAITAATSSITNNVFNNTRITVGALNGEWIQTKTSGAARNSMINTTLVRTGTVVSFEAFGNTTLKGMLPGEVAYPNPSGQSDIEKYLNITGTAGDSWIYLNVSYNDSDWQDAGIISENSLKTWDYTSGAWTDEGFFEAGTNGVDLVNHVVRANITEFASVFAPMGRITPVAITWNWPDLNSTIAVDYTAPCVSLDETGNCTLHFNGTDYVNDTQGTDICWALTGLLDGNYSEVNATCDDIYGNPADSSDVWVNVDTIAPALTINSAQNTTLTNTTHLFNITLDEPGNCTLHLNGTDYQNDTVGTNPLWAITLGQGNYSAINYTCEDVYGNPQDSSTYWLFVDSVAPTIAWNWLDANLTIAVDYTTPCVSLDETGNCTLHFNGTDYVNDTQGTDICWALADLPNGNYSTVSATCDDVYNNSADSGSVWVDVSASPCPNDMPGWGAVGDPCQIDACDDDLTVANLYYELQNNISAVGTCLEILANNVTLELNSYNISGDDDGLDFGVSAAGYDDITVRNGGLMRFGKTFQEGVGLYLTNSDNNVISNITVSDSGIGIYLTDVSESEFYDISSPSNSLYGIFSESSTDNMFDNAVVSTSTEADLYIYEFGSACNDTYFVDYDITTYDIRVPSKLIFENNYGKVNFTEGINGSGVDLMSDLQIGNNTAFVNSTNQPGFNKSAVITLDLTGWGIVDPVILKDGIACVECSILNYTGGVITFNITSWSDYTVVGTCGNSIIEPGEECETGACCDLVTCLFEPVDSICRAAVGQCDVAENCTGLSADCPANSYQPDDTACNDGQACTTGDRCISGACRPTADNCGGGADPCEGVDCDDGNVCTTDSCDDGDCVYTDNTASCDDGDACTINDVCSGGVCGGTPRICDDSKVCTDDSCDSATGCVYTADDSNSCDDGKQCTSGDHCDSGTCTFADYVNGSCSDGDSCTRDDYCMNGDCISGRYICTCESDADCDDDNPCTDETCLDTICGYSDVSGPCSDGNECTEDDYCSKGICKSGENICEYECDHDWECTVWTNCTEGVQTRVCKCDCFNLNCTGSNLTIQTCELTLPSLSINAEPYLLVGQVLHIEIDPVVAMVVLVRPDGSIIQLGETASADYTIDQTGLWEIRAFKEGYNDAESEVAVNEGPAQLPKDFATQLTESVESIVEFVVKEPLSFALLLCTIVGLVGLFIYWKRHRKPAGIEKL